MSETSQIQRYSKPHFSFNRLIFYGVSLAALLFVYFKFSEIRLIEKLFLGTNITWLAIIVCSQVISYIFTALNYRDVLKIKETEVDVWELFPITFVIQFLNQALPSAGVSGQAFFIQYLRKKGLSVAEGIGRAFLELMTMWMAVGAFFIISVILLFQSGAIKQIHGLVYVIYVFAFLAVLCLGIFVATQSKRRGRFTRWVVSKLQGFFEKKKNVSESNIEMAFRQFKETLNFKELQKKGRYFWYAFLWQNLFLLMNVFTLYLISLAVGFPLTFLGAFIVFTITKFIGMIAFVPGALGVFEGAMTLILVSFGIPGSGAFALTLLFRAFTFWFPMPIGWILYRWFIHRQELQYPDLV